MTITHLVTHSGGFHADELLSSVILTRLFPEAEIVRSRDEGWITPGEGKIIYDVGRRHDPDARIFDHHQSPTPKRPDGAPYSSFGLVWAHYGRAYLRALGQEAAHVDEVHAAFDRGFVRPVDLLDNGAIAPSVAGDLAGLTLPGLLEALKPVFDARDAGAEDAAFAAALPVARALVEGVLRQLGADARAEAIVMAAIAQCGAAPVLELPMGMPYRAAIEKAGADHILFVIHPRDGDWALNGIKIAADSFDQRADLPAAWAGLADAALEAASGVKGARFCHSARFLAVARTREAILEMAALAVAEHEAR